MNAASPEPAARRQHLPARPLGAGRLGYMPALDGLRGVAVLLVLLFHGSVFPFSGGFIGVDVFFVLSGYLITSLLLAEFAGTNTVSLRQFYGRRLLRLAPALLLLLLVFSLVSWWRVDGELLRARLREVLWAATYLSNWARAWALEPMTYLGHTWSLAIEEQFYLLWPAVFLLLRRTHWGERGVLVTALAIALGAWAWRMALALHGASAERLYNGLDTRIDTIMAGCALAVLARQRALASWSDLAQTWMARCAVAAAAGLLVAACLLQWDARSLYLVFSTVVTVLAVVVIVDVACNPGSHLRTLLSWRPLVALGVVSYGVYLWHFVVYVIMYVEGVGWWGIRLCGSALTLLLALLSYRWVELPFLRLKARWRPRGAG